MFRCSTSTAMTTSIRVFSELLNPCYSIITDLLTELNGVKFHKFGMALLDEQAGAVKSRIFQLENCVSNAIREVGEVGMRTERQEKELFSKNIKMEKLKITKSTEKKEKEILLSDNEIKLRLNEDERLMAEREVLELELELRLLTLEKSSLNADLNKIKKELKCLESIIQEREKVVSNLGVVWGMCIAGTVISGVTAVLSLGATTPLLLATASGAVASAGVGVSQAKIENIQHDISDNKKRIKRKLYQLKAIKNKLQEKTEMLDSKMVHLVELKSASLRISSTNRSLTQDCCELEKAIKSIETEIENQTSEIGVLKIKSKQISLLSKSLKEITSQVTKMHSIAIVLQSDSQLCLILNNLARNLEEFDSVASNLESSVKSICGQTNSIEFNEMKHYLEDFKKRVMHSSKMGINRYTVLT